MKAEERRLKEAQERGAHWRRWGSYLSERQWGTVREDDSPDGPAGEYFPHDHARSRASHRGEDGLAGTLTSRVTETAPLHLLPTLQQDPRWRDRILCHEYFHGDESRGIGASHPAGRTALVARLIEQSGE
jgi:hypothetical protein